jgi:hypothetical protein
MQNRLNVKKLITQISAVFLCLAWTSFAFAATDTSNQTTQNKKKKQQAYRKMLVAQNDSGNGQPTLEQFKAALSRNHTTYNSNHLNSTGKSYATPTLQQNTNPTIAAASAFSQSQTLSFKPQKMDEPSFSGVLGVSYSESMIDHKDGTRQASQSLNAQLGWSFSEDYSLTSKFSVDKDLRDSETYQGNGLSDIAFILAHKPWDLARWLQGTVSVSTVAPTSDESNKVFNLQSALGVNYTFSLTPAVLARGVETSLTLGASRNFHRYNTDVNGNELNEYGLKQIFDAGYTYAKFIYFSFEFIHRTGFKYDGTASETFEHTEEIGYNPTSKWNVAVGHTNSGSWLRANEQDSNLKLYNENDSIVYLSTSVKF